MDASTESAQLIDPYLSSSSSSSSSDSMLYTNFEFCEEENSQTFRKTPIDLQSQAIHDDKRKFQEKSI